ncbi:hypothetical protein SAMN04488038_10683 [Solimonas aquatica]|uniref:Uncharacterized protein n=1 Tax=Solimonas aquatica TaxID=489703 RepID=A0A1H9FSP9_9GAMM|nr:hypothetical protein [Solimonas aquatica]SEQ40886.1 hypothetical protein SAMN04488038_10683 [Solimonas aquatica]
MSSSQPPGRDDAGIALLLVVGLLLPPGLWLWVDSGRAWWLLYLAWGLCIFGVAALRWRRRA